MLGLITRSHRIYIIRELRLRTSNGSQLGHGNDVLLTGQTQRSKQVGKLHLRKLAALVPPRHPMNLTAHHQPIVTGYVTSITPLARIDLVLKGGPLSAEIAIPQSNDY